MDINDFFVGRNQGEFDEAKRGLIIAGPCSAETREQVLETGMAISNAASADVIRAGIWKPRTRPGSFEGVGEKGLPWLKELKENIGLPVAVEVAKPEHVDACLKYGIDIFWIGARTTANPFAVQELAEALRGVDIPIFVKNPINPDLALWIGAIERLERTTSARLAAIHRGFSYYGEKYYRNRPQWQIPLEFKQEREDIPLICDPSHICGRRDILLDVSQKAIDLKFDGLMIETHRNPDDAWSDAAQQVTPKALSGLLSNIVWRSEHVSGVSETELNTLRKDIDHIDDQILSLLSNRMDIVKDIGVYKKENKMTIFQQERWNYIRQKAKQFAEDHGLSMDFIDIYLKGLHDESIDKQERIMRNNK